MCKNACRFGCEATWHVALRETEKTAQEHKKQPFGYLAAFELVFLNNAFRSH